MSRDKLLVRFAERTLARLEADEEWDADTTEAIGVTAIELGLAELDDNGMFRRTREEDTKKGTK